MAVKMWLQALRTVPRISKEEWQKLDVVSRWLIATRSVAILASTVPSALVGGFFAFRDGYFDGGLLFLIVFGLFFAHATNNLINDLVDHATGLDRGNYFRAQYGPHPLEHELISPRGLLLYIGVSALVALAIAGYLLMFYEHGWLWLLVLLGTFFVLFYTFPLKRIGLGEPSMTLIWGPLIVGGTYYVLSGRWNWDVALAGLPLGLAVTIGLFGKHLDKLDDDRRRGVYTLPVLIGSKASRWLARVLILVQYGLVLYLTFRGFYTPVVPLILLLSVSRARAAWKMFASERPQERPPDYPEEVWPLWYLAAGFGHMRRFGGTYFLAIFVDALVQRYVLPWLGG